MSLPPAMVKPFAAAWRARSYFLFSFVFWVAHSTVPAPFASVASVDRQWWQDLVDKAVGSFDKLSYFLFLAGLIYAVASDVIDYVWTNSLQAEVRKGFVETGEVLTRSLAGFTSGLVGMTFESVKVWVDGGRGSPDQVRTVARSALVSHYGRHNDQASNLLDFVMRDLLDKWARDHSQVWDNFSSNVTVRPSSIKGHFEWQETRTYTVICFSREGELPLRLEGSVQIGAVEVMTALDQMEFRIRFGQDEIVNFKDWWAKHRDKAEGGRFTVQADGITIAYEGLWLRYEISAQCPISDERTDVRIFERSYISTEDRSYSLAIRHPTRTVNVSFSIEGLPKWSVKRPVASATLYQHDQRAVQIESLHERSCSAIVPGWSLPGIAVVVEWAPG